MQVNNIQPNNYNNQPNFKGFVGPSMTKYVSAQMERELTDLYARNKKFGPFANTSIIADRVKALHTQVQNKLNRFMSKLDLNISMEYERGVVRLQNNDSQKSLSFIDKDAIKGVTGEVYGDKIDVFSPLYIEDSGENTLLYINSFANALEEKVLNKIENINKTLAK